MPNFFSALHKLLIDKMLRNKSVGHLTQHANMFVVAHNARHGATNKRSTESIALIAMRSANACSCHLHIVPAHHAAGKCEGIVQQTGKLP